MAYVHWGRETLTVDAAECPTLMPGKPTLTVDAAECPMLMPGKPTLTVDAAECPTLMPGKPTLIHDWHQGRQPSGVGVAACLFADPDPHLCPCGRLRHQWLDKLWMSVLSAGDWCRGGEIWALGWNLGEHQSSLPLSCSLSEDVAECHTGARETHFDSWHPDTQLLSGGWGCHCMPVSACLQGGRSKRCALWQPHEPSQTTLWHLWVKALPLYLEDQSLMTNQTSWQSNLKDIWKKAVLLLLRSKQKISKLKMIKTKILILKLYSTRH